MKATTTIFGMSTATYTLIHVVISLIGIGSGLVVMYGLLGGKRLRRWTAVFLTSTVLTSVTGFGFPFDHLTPANKLGIMSLVVLAIAIVARYPLHLAGVWRGTYVISAAIALYFNMFVLVVQSFEKLPVLKALAPTQKEPPFVIAQLVLMAIFVVLTIFAVRRFRGGPVPAARSDAHAA